MRRLRVAMVGPYPDADGRIVGGVAAVTSYLSSALHAMGDLDLHGITFKRHVKDHESSAALGYPVHSLPAQPFGPLTLFRRQLAAFDELIARLQPDVVHGQGVDFPGFAAVRSAVPSVVTVHGLVGEDAKYLTGFRRRWRAKLISYRVERRTVRLARDVIVISPFVEEYYGERLKARTHTIPNPVASEFFALERRPEPGRFLFAGHINPRKGVLDLVRAFAPIATQSLGHLVLAGSLDVTRDYVQRVRELCQELGIEQRVEFRGVLSRAELLAELAKAQALVLPSYQETAPMVVQEAMAAGVAVIASRICGVPYQVEEGVTGWLFQPGDVDALSQRMRSLVLDPSKASRMGAAAKSRADQYRAERVARSTRELYERIASRADAATQA